MTTAEIINNITSCDTHQVWKSALEIIRHSQDSEKIIPLIAYLPQIEKSTKGLDMGGHFAPNQRFIDFAIVTIKFHKKSKECACALYSKKYKLTSKIITREVRYDMFDPNDEAKKGNIKIREIKRIEQKWIDYYIVQCSRCKTKYKVEERDGHYMCWYWEKMD